MVDHILENDTNKALAHANKLSELGALWSYSFYVADYSLLGLYAILPQGTSDLREETYASAGYLLFHMPYRIEMAYSIGNATFVEDASIVSSQERESTRG